MYRLKFSSTCKQKVFAHVSERSDMVMHGTAFVNLFRQISTLEQDTQDIFFLKKVLSTVLNFAVLV
jgi:hypothetical protein